LRILTPYTKSCYTYSYTSISVRVVKGQQSKHSTVNGQSPEISTVKNVKPLKRAGQSFDLRLQL